MTEAEVDRMFAQIRDKSISEESEKYAEVLSNIHVHPQKVSLLKQIFQQVDSPTMFLGMAVSFFTKMEAEGKKDTDGTCTLAILKFSRTLCHGLNGNYDLLSGIAFAYLEKTAYRYLEIKDELYSILEEVEKHGVKMDANVLAFLLTERPVHILTEALLFLSAETLVSVLEYVIEEAGITKNTSLQRNTASLLQSVAAGIKGKKVFAVIAVYIQALKNEAQAVRNAAIEGMANISIELKKEIQATKKGEKELLAITALLCERTKDVSVFCRARAIQTFTELAVSDALHRKARKPVAAAVLPRLKDRTHTVRKKAVGFFRALLHAHPFLLDGGLLTESIIDKSRKEDTEYHKDCVQFYESVLCTLQVLEEVLLTNTRSELVDIIQYVSSCAIYGIEMAVAMFPLLFNLVWESASADGMPATDTLCAEISRISDGDPHRLVFLLLVWDNDALSYNGIIRELTLRGVLNTGIMMRALVRAEKTGTPDTYIKTLRLVRRVSQTDRTLAEAFLEASGSLADEKRPDVLTESVMILGHLDYRVDNNSATICAIVNAVQYVSHESLELLQAIIDTLYLISMDPAPLAVGILSELTVSRRTLPLLFSIGHIGLRQAVHLERMEAAWNGARRPEEKAEEPENKKQKTGARAEIRERRLSIGSRRPSVKATTEEQEEMADRVFFAKEHEMLYNDDAALAAFGFLLPKYLEHKHLYTRKVALVAVGKLMAVSSEYAAQNIGRIQEMVRGEQEEEMVIACLVILADVVMAFSSILGEVSGSLFAAIERKVSWKATLTALVLVRHLLRTGMIKVKENYWLLARLLLEGEEVGLAAQKLFEEIMAKKGASAVVCEVLMACAADRIGKGKTQSLGKQGHAAPDLHASQQSFPNQVVSDQQVPESPAEDRDLRDILRVLARISSAPELGKKVLEWSAGKTEPELLEVCSIASSELCRWQKPIDGVQ